jgi:hypothetical protein
MITQFGTIGFEKSVFWLCKTWIALANKINLLKIVNNYYLPLIIHTD